MINDENSPIFSKVATKEQRLAELNLYENSLLHQALVYSNEPSCGRDTNKRSLELLGIIKDSCTTILKVLGRGHSESIYHRALETELRHRNIKYETEKIVTFYYRDTQVGWGRADLVIDNLFIVELKTISTSPRSCDVNQLKNYMSALSITNGAVVNFGTAGSTQREMPDIVAFIDDKKIG